MNKLILKHILGIFLIIFGVESINGLIDYLQQNIQATFLYWYFIPASINAIILGGFLIYGNEQIP